MSKINILGIEYNIKIISFSELSRYYNNDSEEQFVFLKKIIGESGEFFGGLTDFQNCIIWINKDMNQDRIKKILVHEIMEAINQEIQGELDHVLLQSITNALYSTNLINLDSILNDEEFNISLYKT